HMFGLKCHRRHFCIIGSAVVLEELIQLLNLVEQEKVRARGERKGDIGCLLPSAQIAFDKAANPAERYVLRAQVYVAERQRNVALGELQFFQMRLGPVPPSRGPSFSAYFAL